MFNTSDSVPRAGEGGSKFSAVGKLQRKVQAHIKLARARAGLAGPTRKLTGLARV